MAGNDEHAVDFRGELEKKIKEEISDIEKYVNLADLSTARFPKSGYAKILKDIALDEMTHAKHLRAILNDMQESKMQAVHPVKASSESTNSKK